MSYLDGLGLFHMDLSLTRMHSALGKLGLERPPYTVVQIVGTNGKGSTATLLAALSQGHGHRTGLYTSPHFVSPRERIRINGSMLPEETWVRHANAVHAAEPLLTYFEFLTVLAVLAFAEAGVDLAVMEAGLGGRHDATTAVSTDLLCITPISMDHEQVLGNTLTAIATDKAGAMREGMTVLHAEQEPEALAVLRQCTTERHATLLAAKAMTPAPTALALGLGGPHQRGNAQLALAAWRYLSTQQGWTCHPQSEAAALRQAFIPGRLQHITLADGTAMILDGAHNAHGLHALAKALQVKNICPKAIIFSCLADKDLEHMLPLLTHIVHELAHNAPLWVPTIAHNNRAAQSSDLAPRISAKAHAVPALGEALNAAWAVAGSGPVLLCGSLYLLGEFFTLHPEFLEINSASEAV